jgi:hypothetical protein
MRNGVAAFVFLTVGFLMVCGQVYAHHGSVAYDMKDEVVLKNATVTKFFWANPHCVLTFDVKDDKGNVVHWTGETGSPSAVGPLGWFRDVVKPGDVITVHIYQSKMGTPVGEVYKIVLADGKEYKDTFGATAADREERKEKGIQ